ncbi:DUF4145 domain-containing protein [Caproiciproducens faecalis]|uniref:DUF4145 domain-containing protein n=1 Tax=Caproiciproducens faecalis TaxID=2820301 RepID=A0ABS7DRG5_9FIRM|nr:DUF4145 domain-containing protein [Caproiciproducens faecalis]MBW7573898.1 DUF4145 domain-containing protein [Caproiciproducens faecalis]
MQKMVFTNKNCRDSFGISDASYNFLLNKPMLCPYCGAYEDGVTVDRKIFSANSPAVFGVITYRCTRCSKIYIVVYDINSTVKESNVAAIYPTTNYSFSNERIEKVSPRFIDIYNQALLCESNNNLELAAIGFRASLEILVKDFAVNELEIDKSVVTKKTLFEAIGEYLNNQELIASGDVVRILGNDYAHYERKYPEQDFEILKSYMEIFIHLVETKLMIAHPPVFRQTKDQTPQVSDHQDSNTP